MGTALSKATDAVRGRVPPLTAVPLPRAVDARWLAPRGRSEPLADPPPGSGLTAVPGDFGPPFVGHSLTAMRFGPDFALRRYERYGPVSWMGMFGQRMVALAGPDATQTALINKDKVFSQQGWNFFIERFFHRGLMLLDFGEHRMHRRIMQEAFTRDRLAAYTEEMTRVAREGIRQWPTGSTMRLYWALKQLTLDIAARVFMDMPPGERADELNRAFVDTVRGGTALIRHPVPGGRWSAGLSGRKVLERFFAERLADKRAGSGSDLFSALCHATDSDGERFSDEDVINHMIFLMMAAHDTSTITSTAAAYYLGTHPDWQERAREESRALGTGSPDLEALESLHTLDLVIKESLRMVAPVPSLPRKALTDTEVLGHYIPQGTLIGVSPAVNHFTPECWTDPMTFDPERFSPGRREDKSHRFAWIPFGGGAHKCIGMHFGTIEVKALLHELLMHYTWSLPQDYLARWDYVALPVPVDGLPVRLRAVTDRTRA
ncbi:cytochrome P450 [Haloechinothrix sp. YIM 98757]|uniref:Cytochrome P450 n=1 Tax=Haloechinothrix aidingensis TaxID=2752311 RepID=A0A838A060_9PSEU|nr:cytochrome P450 [Haloechinothrix aidingensis]MBA0125914.1 cytochrome P450 [Haloechinothrix aidingensis]